ncbi:hypothetical protein RRG08_035247 [Elysia crispata]|uniref:Uncharacterized protein n=1 Tax=Elysia crispata TaxID=231223 RepID=A0AAE0ZN38_9GAST|nr:hypothetical protein RRG08_035247 [Elysia crispata]
MSPLWKITLYHWKTRGEKHASPQQQNAAPSSLVIAIDLDPMLVLSRYSLECCCLCAHLLAGDHANTSPASQRLRRQALEPAPSQQEPNGGNTRGSGLEKRPRPH